VGYLYPLAQALVVFDQCPSMALEPVAMVSELDSHFDCPMQTRREDIMFAMTYRSTLPQVQNEVAIRSILSMESDGWIASVQVSGMISEGYDTGAVVVEEWTCLSAQKRHVSTAVPWSRIKDMGLMEYASDLDGRQAGSLLWNTQRSSLEKIHK
jgi:hypothetical protein